MLPDTDIKAGTDAAALNAPTQVPTKERPLWPALARGWRRKCPRCGNGPLMRSYLKMRESCTVCRQDFRPARADDGPAYLTILIVGHLMAPTLHIAFVTFRPEPLILFTVFAVGCVALSLYLLPRLKGAIVAFQWAREMFGFATSQSDPLDECPAT
ncbi:MAG: DUF983 domain-containing protein [Planktotalea sp.]|uniref:DUF983 domain-containing protein n=1 Tax=Planktotalea sp. TaxID=2029877 RepID=UPI003C73F32D